MHQTFAARALATRVRELPDGRRVTIRHSVPSDAPRIGLAFGSARAAAWGFDLVAFDDHGAVVGHATSPTDVAVAKGWDGCRLTELLALESKEG
jgi:hypothetical protein